MKKLLIRIVVVLVILVVVAVAIVMLSLNSIVKKGVETAGPMITRVPVTLGAAEISPFSGSGRLLKFVVGNPEGYKTTNAISVGDIKVAVSPGSVMSDVIVVNEFAVKDAVVNLEGTLNANNLTKLMNNINGSSTSEPKPKGEPATANPSTSKSSKKFIVKDLDLEGIVAVLNLTLPVVGTQTMTIPVPPIHLTNIGTDTGGVTVEQLSQTVMKPLMDAVMKSATDAIANSAGQFKDMGKNMASGLTSNLNGALGTNGGSLTNAVKGVTDFFHKK